MNNVKTDKKLINIIILHNYLKPLSIVYLRKRASSNENLRQGIFFQV